MESVGSNSPSENRRSLDYGLGPIRRIANRRSLDSHLMPSRPMANRLYRALRHTLRLLHRSGSSFYLLGTTWNVYTVTLTATPSCTCPDRTSPCKHVLFVLLRVLGVTLDDPCLRRRTLRPSKLRLLLRTPTLPDTLARAGLREKFRELFFQGKLGDSQPRAGIEDGATCPVCLDEMGKEERVVVCETCRNGVHEECLTRWKISNKGMRAVRCVLCRARYRNDPDKYLNMGAYIEDDDLPPSRYCESLSL